MYRHMRDTSAPAADFTIPRPQTLSDARSKLISQLPNSGIGTQEVNEHLTRDIAPALSESSRSPNYYGFVTGGATPAATFADHFAVDHDQNVQVHLPSETVATDVEDCALRMLCQLLYFNPGEWQHRTFTTGATASNILGLACGRQYVLQQAVQRLGLGNASAAEHGLYSVMKSAGVDEVQVLTSVPHSSLRKAASVVGFGRGAVVDVSSEDLPHRFHLGLLEEHLRRANTVSIVSVSCAEVNTGLFATNGEDMRSIRKLCDKYGAWLHVDAAFGLLARILPDTDDYRCILAGVEGMDLADSITGDAHKLFNVPYDCGFFLSRHLSLATEIFQNTNAAYLSSSSSSTIPSPLNIGIENSRRFRALPVYATLAAYGRDGYREMLERQIKLTRAIAEVIRSSPEYELLPPTQSDEAASVRMDHIYIILLFRARDDHINDELVQRVNSGRRIYISGTAWNGKPAARFAISNWQADVDRDLECIKEVLKNAVRS